MASLRSTLRLGFIALATVALVAPIGATVPTTAAAAPIEFDRVAGKSQYSTAFALSRLSHPDGAETVYLTSGTDSSAGVAAASSAAQSGSPLLFTYATSLPATVAAELSRLSPTNVVIIGDTASVSTAVATSVSSLGATVTRISGTDRFEVSRNVVSATFTEASTAWLVPGAAYADALPAIAAAGRAAEPVILIDGAVETLDEATSELLNTLGVTNLVVVGTDDSLTPSLEVDLMSRTGTATRLGGADTFAVARAVSTHTFTSASRAILASALPSAAGAAGAVYAATIDSPLLTSQKWCVPPETLSEMTDRLAVDSHTLVGTVSELTDPVGLLTPCTEELIAQRESEAELRAALVSRISTLRGKYAVSVRELGGAERSVDINGTSLKEPASVMKLFAAYAILKRVDSGKISLNKRTRSGVTVSTCLRVMIHVSDNLCHWDLVAMLGSTTKLNAELYADGFVNTGYAGTLVGGRKLYTKRTSTSDMALLMSRLEDGTLLSAASNARLLSLTESQVWRSRIPSGVPRGIEVADKPGALWLSSGMVHSDAAIVRAPEGSYVITILASHNATATGLSYVSRVVYEHFNGDFGTAASYSSKNLVTSSKSSLYRYVGSGYVRSIPSGTRVAAYSSNRNWYRIIYQGKYYWMNSAQLKNVYNYMN